ncbi:PGPGW domain-containing protein [Pendulispora albinea]|uniref:Transmembrane protein (PGPGW) n=1 Tax=Pendulispora albinea TaxID=2741071 RepID=A0ABZ2M2V6_9BACT
MDSTQKLAVLLGAASVIMVVVGMIGVKLFVVRVPADYFVAPPPRRSPLARVVRTVLGVILVLAGVVMLVLPGQGVLTIVVGLLVLELPIQHKVAGWLVARPAVARVIETWRRRAGRPPLQMPQTPDAPDVTQGEKSSSSSTEHRGTNDS